jgi:hypothetical protein
VEVGDHGVVRATRGSNTRRGQSHRQRLLRRGDALPAEAWRKRFRLDDLASKSVSRGTLVLSGEGHDRLKPNRLYYLDWRLQRGYNI